MAGRVKAVEWKESAEELHKIFKAESDVERRKRVQALWLLRQGTSQTQTAQTVGVGCRTVVRWLGWYREGGLAEVTKRVPGHGAPGGTSRLSPEQLQELVEHTKTGALRTYEDARQWVLQQYGVEYRYQGMYSVLARVGVHPKVPRPIAVKADRAAQEAFKKGGLVQH